MMQCLALAGSPALARPQAHCRAARSAPARPVPHRRPSLRRGITAHAATEMDASPEGILSGEWEAGWSLVSYEDVQEYFDRKVLREGHHPTTRLSAVMSTHLRTVYPNDPISEAEAYFGQVSGLPVLRPGDDVLIGVVSKKDLSKKPGGSRVADFMSAPPIALKKTNTVEHAAALMLKHKIHRIPVVDDDKRVIGMVTRTDLFNALAGGDVQVRNA